LPEHFVPKFLYLNDATHVNAWVNGGEVPFRLASSYRAAERNGVFTPDENGVLKIRAHVSQPATLTWNASEHSKTIMWLSSDQYGNVVPMAMDVGFVDGVLLCLSNNRNDQLWAERAGKRACVSVEDTVNLEKLVCEQLAAEGLFEEQRNSRGVQSEQGSCEYTATMQRDVFLKGVEDSWQDEYRLVWHSRGPVRVMIPAGTAQFVWQAAG
jgi:hypothetical protein